MDSKDDKPSDYSRLLTAITLETKIKIDGPCVITLKDVAKYSAVLIIEAPRTAKITKDESGSRRRSNSRP